jgi:RNA polymerase sigma factor (sigma-70 family)
MKPSDFSMAEPAMPNRFNTTHWSVVLEAGKAQSAQSAEALEKLCLTYWLPLYAFIRRQGSSPHDAQDLTQEFFARLLKRNDFDRVDPRKGRFRTFLLTSLTHFLSNERDRVRAAKRGGGQQIISLDAIQAEEMRQLEPRHDLSPDKVFDMRWAMTVLEKSLSRLQHEMMDEGKSCLFAELKSFLTSEPETGEYALISERLGKTPQTLAVAVHRLRARYRELVCAEVAHTVGSPLEVDDEMRYLLSVLN